MFYWHPRACYFSTLATILPPHPILYSFTYFPHYPWQITSQEPLEGRSKSMSELQLSWTDQSAWGNSLVWGKKVNKNYFQKMYNYLTMFADKYEVNFQKTLPVDTSEKLVFTHQNIWMTSSPWAHMHKIVHREAAPEPCLTQYVKTDSIRQEKVLIKSRLTYPH